MFSLLLTLRVIGVGIIRGERRRRALCVSAEQRQQQPIGMKTCQRRSCASFPPPSGPRPQPARCRVNVSAAQCQRRRNIVIKRITRVAAAAGRGGGGGGAGVRGPIVRKNAYTRACVPTAGLAAELHNGPVAARRTSRRRRWGRVAMAIARRDNIAPGDLFTRARGPDTYIMYNSRRVPGPSPANLGRELM